MKFSKALLLLWVALLGGMLCVRAEETVIANHEFLSQTLSGHVVVGIGKVPVEGVTVELHGTDWKTVLASTKTDKNGYFFLAKPKQGESFYLQFSEPRLNSYRLPVRIKKHAPKELFIEMINAT